MLLSQLAHEFQSMQPYLAHDFLLAGNCRTRTLKRQEMELSGTRQKRRALVVNVLCKRSKNGFFS